MSNMSKSLELPKRLRGMKSVGVIRARDDMIAHEVLVNGLTRTEVGRRFGLTKQAISHIIQRVEQDHEVIEKYNAQKAEIQAHNQMKRQVLQDKVLDSLTDKELEKADLKTKMLILNTLGLDKTREFEAERLVRGQSTQNTHAIVEMIDRMKEEDDTGAERPKESLPG